MKRKCECCGEDITDLNQHPYAHRCERCRYTYKKKHTPATRCKRCGAEITDLDIHYAARLCIRCRNQAGRVGFDIADKYQPTIEAYLNEHGWPTYTNGRKLVALYPDILTENCPEINTQKRKQQIIAACIKDLRKADGMRYVYYNTQVDVLTEVEL